MFSNEDGNSIADDQNELGNDENSIRSIKYMYEKVKIGAENRAEDELYL